jgi:hypothetical protein
MIVWHGSTIENKEAIEREGLRPNTYAAATRELASNYAQVRAMERGSDGYALWEVDVPDSAVVEVQSWWWASGQLLLPFGAPPSALTLVELEDLREASEEDLLYGSEDPSRGTNNPPPGSG